MVKREGERRRKSSPKPCLPTGEPKTRKSLAQKKVKRGGQKRGKNVTGSGGIEFNRRPIKKK